MPVEFVRYRAQCKTCASPSLARQREHAQGGLHHAEHASQGGYLVGVAPVGITRAIEPLVVLRHGLGQHQRVVPQARQQMLAQARMRDHLPVLVQIEHIAGTDQRRVKVQLADVVQQTRHHGAAQVARVSPGPGHHGASQRHGLDRMVEDMGRVGPNRGQQELHHRVQRQAGDLKIDLLGPGAQRAHQHMPGVEQFNEGAAQLHLVQARLETQTGLQWQLQPALQQALLQCRCHWFALCQQLHAVVIVDVARRQDGPTARGLEDRVQNMHVDLVQVFFVFHVVSPHAAALSPAP